MIHPAARRLTLAAPALALALSTPLPLLASGQDPDEAAQPAPEQPEPRPILPPIDRPSEAESPPVDRLERPSVNRLQSPPPAPTPSASLNRLQAPVAPVVPSVPSVDAAASAVTRRAAAGSALRLRLEEPLAGRAAQGQSVRATLAEPLLDASGRVVLPEGTVVEGEVRQARAPKRFRRRGKIEIAFGSARLPDGRAVALAAASELRGSGDAGRGAATIGVLAAAGGAGSGGSCPRARRSASFEGAALGALVGSLAHFGSKPAPFVVPAGSIVEADLARDLDVDHLVRTARTARLAAAAH